MSIVRSIFAAILLLSVAILPWVRTAEKEAGPITFTTNDYSALVMTNIFDYGTNFLTISNRTHLDIHGTVLLRLTDQEWDLITNYFSEFLTTNEISFYGK